MFTKRFALASALWLLAGCGGSAPNVVPERPAQLQRPAAAGRTNISNFVELDLAVVILNPAATRIPQSGAGKVTYVSPGTRSVGIDGSAEKPQLRADVGPNIKACRRQASGVMCRLTFQTTRGTSGFTFFTYDRPLAGDHVNGRLLNYGTSALTAKNDQNALSFSVNSIIGSVALGLRNTAPPASRVSDLGLQLDVRDAAGYRILTGTYLDSNLVPDGLWIVCTTQPSTIDSYAITVNGKAAAVVNSPTDRYVLKYLGHGILYASVDVQGAFTNRVFQTKTFRPQETNVAVAAAPRGIAASSLGVPATGVESFLEPSGTIGLINGSALTEESVPSGNRPSILELAYYNWPLVRWVFATQQNTLGLIDNQRDVSESVPVKGGPIVSLTPDLSPLYAQSDGTIGEWFSGSDPNSIRYRFHGTPDLTNISGQGAGYTVSDAGNHAIFSFDQLFPDFKTPIRTALPHGTPAFTVYGSDSSTWIVLAHEPGGFVAFDLKLHSQMEPFHSKAPLTSLALMRFGDIPEWPMAGTDANGNIEFFSASGKWLSTYVPKGGPATDIVAGANEDMYYICTSCPNGVQELVY